MSKSANAASPPRQTIPAAATAELNPPLVAGRTAIWVCAALLMIFALLAWLSVRGKCATYDEPLHVTAAWELARHHDFRVNPEDPCLWQYWAALPQSESALRPDRGPLWQAIPSDIKWHWPWSVTAMYATPGVDADAFLARSRAMMLVPGVLLGVAIGWWAGQIAGGVAAIAATALFAFDPNFLAHAPLVKNDVTMALVMFAMVWAAWRCGRRLTWLSAAAVVASAAAGPVVKFSGNSLTPFLAVILAGRALLPWPWRCFDFEARTVVRRLAVAAGLCGAAAVASWLLIWACYDFRFSVSPDSRVRMDFSAMILQTAQNDIASRHPDRGATRDEVDHWNPPALVKAIEWARDHRALPEAWLYGLLYTYRSSRVRSSFLWGQYSVVGFPLYFPLAFIFKTPMATQAALLLSLGVGAAVAFSRRRTPSPSLPAALHRKSSSAPPTMASTAGRWPAIWTALCLALPAMMYATSAIRSNLNLGLRHLLPVYPFLYVAIALAASAALRRWRRLAVMIGAGLAIGLAGETLLAFPDYIPFFNGAAGGARGGLKLLSDSNLDWGQDLKLVADWQRRHPDVKLYLSYFGMADPRYYGLRFTNMPGGFAGYDVSAEGSELVVLPAPTGRFDAPGVLAISATNLQGTYRFGTQFDLYAPLRELTPLEVLGGSIYLYEINVMPAPATSAAKPAATATAPTATHSATRP
jgi:hypothetical protein